MPTIHKVIDEKKTRTQRENLWVFGSHLPLGNLHKNVAELTQNLNNERSEREKLQFMAIKRVGEHLIDTFPIFSVQQGSCLYLLEKEDSNQHISNKRRKSNMVY